MVDPRKPLDAVQSEWPLLPSLAIVGIADTPPAWAMSSAQRVVAHLQPNDLMAWRVQLPGQVAFLGALYRRWVVAAVLAVLLALAVVSTAHAIPLDNLRLGVLIGVLSAILMPPMVICNGIARDYTAARALMLALKSTVQQPV